MKPETGTLYVEAMQGMTLPQADAAAEIAAAIAVSARVLRLAADLPLEAALPTSTDFLDAEAPDAGRK